MADMNVCCVCDLPVKGSDDSQKLYEKGAAAINEVSQNRGDKITAIPGTLVHTECRKQYCHPTTIAAENKRKLTDDSNESINLRSKEKTFIFRSHCLFCEQTDKYGGKKKNWELLPVRTKEFDRTIKEECKKRNDIWSNKVLGRIESVNDLHAADAVYHHLCSSNFRTGKDVPQLFVSADETLLPAPKRRQVGIPSKTEVEETLELGTEYVQ